MRTGRTFVPFRGWVPSRTGSASPAASPGGPLRIRLASPRGHIVPSRSARPVLHRAVGAAVTGLLLVQALLPAAALAAPGGPPKPTDDVITTTEGTPATGNVLTNDTNLGDGTLTVTGQGALSASVGTLVIGANGAYTFTPATDWFGTATTTYNVANDKHTRTANITINVSNVQDPPNANDDTVTAA